MSSPSPIQELRGTIGRDPDHPDSDAAFYDWITGSDQEKILPGVFEWLLEDLREEQDPKEIRKLLTIWKQESSAEDFSQRLEFFKKIFPDGHPLKAVLKEFETSS